MASATFDIVVVGGGFAGLSAAIAAAEAGAGTLLVDERPAPGQERLERVNDEPLLPRAAAAGVDIRHGSLVWGIFGGHRLAVFGAGESTGIQAKAVVLATGSVTVTDPSPGWTHPEIRLALMAECAAGYSARLGGWVPGRSSHLATSIPGVFVAGDCGGLCPGVDCAAAEGRLAGLSAAASLGFGTTASQEDAVAALERAAPGRLAEIAALDAWYVQGPLGDVPPAESYSDDPLHQGQDDGGNAPGEIICPCEAVTEATIRAAVAAGGRTLNDVKRRTRAGMGVCQGVQCGHPIRTMICEQTGTDPARIPPMTSRPPVRLLHLADLAATS